MKRKTRRLGKGLDALLGDAEPIDEPEGEGVRSVEISSVRPNPFQPRRAFSEEKLGELAESIRVHGVVQPVLLRPDDGDYEIVAGERRLRAAEMAGLESIPAIITDLEDQEMMEVALVENLQREDLSPMEQASAYSTLQKEVGLTQTEVAERIGISRSQVANVLRLLHLPERVQDMIQDGLLGLGHAKIVLGLPRDERTPFAEMVVSEQLTVRQAEEAFERWRQSQPPGEEEEGEGGQEEPDDATAGDDLQLFVRDVQERLARHLGTPVRLSDRGGRGKISIEYYDYEDLDRLLDMLLA